MNSRGGAPLAALLVTLGAACGLDPANTALAAATGHAQCAARSGAAEVQAVLRSDLVDPADAASVETWIRAVDHDRQNGTPHAVRVDPGGRVVLTATFLGYGQAGGGGNLTTVAVRACVRMEGTPGRSAEIVLTDDECDPASPAVHPGFGNVDATVRLDD